MTSNTAASDLKKHIGFWMRMVSNLVSHSFSRKLEGCGVTVAEWVILREMYSRRDSIAPSDIAQLTNLTRGAVSKLVDRLLEKKLVTRSESAEDRRYQKLGLTAEAKKMIPKLAKLADRNDDEFFSALTLHEKKTLTDLLKKVAAANRISKMPTE